jgi:hypothetical protein
MLTVVPVLKMEEAEAAFRYRAWGGLKSRHLVFLLSG